MLVRTLYDAEEKVMHKRGQQILAINQLNAQNLLL